MKKSKAKTVDLLYTSPKENKKTEKRQKNKKKSVVAKNEKINIDNEIIIGLTPKNKKKPKKESQKLNKQKQVKGKKAKENIKKNKLKTNKQPKKEQSLDRKLKLKIFKWTTLAILILFVVVLFMMSSVFNIKQVTVSNNSRLSADEIISISGIKTNENMFKMNVGNIKKTLKSNAYIEEIKIIRKLNGIVDIKVKERVATYMLKFANGYMYIDNQGYMLELSENIIETPIITGFVTPVEDIAVGNRLIVDDLYKLETVIKIVETAKNKGFANLITEIDISDQFNYKITFQSELKTVEFGDSSNINEKMLWIQKLLEEEKGVEGEIVVKDPNKKKVYFKEKV